VIEAWWLGAVSAFWLGLLTAISPCPLATNIAALSFVGRRLDRPRAALLRGLLYTLGRTLTYVALAALLVASLLSAPALAHWLQTYMNRLLGPLLILVGMVLLDLLPLRLPGLAGGADLQRRAESWGLAGAALLGVLFALSFCPVSAALFFGSLLPLAVRHQSSLALPALYGLGTGLPVLAFAVLVALGATRVGAAFQRLGAFERWARRVTGGLFLAIGLYYALAYSLGLAARGP
jgi:cytochrome c-type biogenesis protein